MLHTEIITVNSDTQIAIAGIAMDIMSGSFDFVMSDADRNMMEGFGSERRKREWLSVRYLLKHILPGEVNLSYDNSGKPLCSSGFVSISHSCKYAAVIYSKNRPVGIDIEQVTPRILRIEKRFLSEEELAFMLPGDEGLFHRYLAWSAKEAIFKLSGNSELSFSENIRIFPFRPESEGAFSAEVLLTGGILRLTPAYKKYSDHSLVWVIKEA